jgi:formiminotetrahydrofolate cyclodeaminase
MKYQDVSMKEFADLLASKAPVPGGGGASALVGSIGIALGNMVGNLTLGKKKYEDVEPSILKLMEKADILQKELLELIDKDAEVFEPLSRAYRLPKDTQEQQGIRAAILKDALKTACTVPLKIMEKCCEAIELHKEFSIKGASIAISDVGCGVSFCKAALQSASLNVYINTKLMTDRAYADDINQKADDMLEQYIGIADDIFRQIRVQ